MASRPRTKTSRRFVRAQLVQLQLSSCSEASICRSTRCVTRAESPASASSCASAAARVYSFLPVQLSPRAIPATAAQQQQLTGQTEKYDCICDVAAATAGLMRLDARAGGGAAESEPRRRVVCVRRHQRRALELAGVHARRQRVPRLRLAAAVQPRRHRRLRTHPRDRHAPACRASAGRVRCESASHRGSATRTTVVWFFSANVTYILLTPKLTFRTAVCGPPESRMPAQARTHATS